jgi:nitroreductase
VEFIQVIKRRRMIHAFTDEPLEPGTAERLLRAANRAPSAVVDEGLGAVFFGIAPEIMASFRAQYGVPAEWMPIGAIAIGHPDPDSDPVPPARASDRKTLDELVHRGHW